MSAETQVNERLRALVEAGCAPWLDQIRRSMVEGGELARMVREESLRGVTSNPSIFEKAILGSEDYDDALRELIGEGLDAPAIFERLAVHDVRGGCDVLAGVHRDTQGADGFVSLEVLPDAAHDTDRTLELARRYFGLVDRPNVMIKIPGTTEGVPAIEQAIYEGINVNVTLLFSVESYTNVAEAYVRGLERRHAEGKALGVHSVASFFVSRVDSNVDQKLAALGREDLIGLAAVANARAAYQRFGEIFSGERWERLASAGAFVQRPLWASTGTKDQRYSDVKYVEELVAPDTVNTMPMATLMAFADHGKVSGPTGTLDPSEDLQKLAEAGIDMEEVTLELLDDGVAQFIDAMNRLLAGVDARLEAVRTRRPPRIDASLPAELRDAIAARVAAAERENVAERIWRHDATLWGPSGTPEIENRLGWLTVSEAMLEHAGELTEFADAVKADGFTDVVLLGMGGSSLGPEVIRRSFASGGERSSGMRLQILDSTHPDEVLAVQDSVDIEKTLFVVSSKSGGTIETLSHFRYFSQLARPDQFVVVTDPGSPLEQLARDNDLRRVFLNPPEIGGRYSVMSLFGLVPAVLADVPVEALLHSCQIGEQSCAHYDSSESNPGLWLGAVIGELARQGRNKLTFLVSDPISSFGLWVEQLIAESTGKEGRGILPVAGEPRAADPAAYGSDRAFLYLRNAENPDGELDAYVDALAQAGHPTFKVDAHGASDLGRIFFLAEFATAVAGWALEINPFDQPNVQEAKDTTARVLEEGLPELPVADDAALRELLTDAGPPHYVALLGYLPPSPALDIATDELRAVIRELTGAAVTFGYGPRFQHSTGQLHKGGPPIGRFLQLINEPVRDAEIPEAGYSFATLVAAQSAGDLQTLRSHDLPAERVALEGDPASAVRALTARIRKVVA